MKKIEESYGVEGHHTIRRKYNCFKGLIMAMSFAILVWVIWAPNEALAYPTYSSGNCFSCHGDFNSGSYVSFKDGTPWGVDLMSGHIQMIAGDCDTCHSNGPRGNVFLNSSIGATGFDPIGCVGCHGRDDDVTDVCTGLGTGVEVVCGAGAGLRQHHFNSGVTVCRGCHFNDADPGSFTPVGEDVPPPYYFTPDAAHPLKPTDPCTDEAIFGPTGLDNDGDGLDDGNDPDCAAGNQPPVADANGPYNGTVGVPLSFDGSGSFDADGTIVAYDWDFGDGNTGTGVTPTHTYAAAGGYTVTLTVTDNDGLTDTATTTAEINLVNCSDPYEPDDDSTQTTSLFPGEPQTHSICPVGDEDWYAFTLIVTSTVTYDVVLETSGPIGDTRMWLYDSGLTQIDYNDDFNDLWSRIDRNCDVDALSPGTYYVKIDEYLNDHEIESYDISLTVTPCKCDINSSPIMDLVAWYYQSILDRCPEQGGAESWAAEIERIVSLGIDIKEGFIALGKLFFNSEEYLLKGKTDEAYIVDLYETFLHRTPSGIGVEVGEVDDWEAELTGGLTRNLLLNYFIFSDEFRTYMEGIFGPNTTRPEYSLVNDLYRGFLSRLPDNGGYNSWLALMQEAQCTGAQAVRDLTNQIGLLFIQSAEYEVRNPEFGNPDFSSEFVTNLYDAVLRRGAELAGYLDWKGYYDSGTLTKEEILQFFVESDEFQGRVHEVIAAGCSACGDGACELPENCSNCPDDCGTCPPVCGDGVCEVPEECEICPDDCFGDPACPE
jgi:PKD repeat protein